MREIFVRLSISDDDDDVYESNAHRIIEMINNLKDVYSAEITIPSTWRFRMESSKRMLELALAEYEKVFGNE